MSDAIWHPVANINHALRPLASLYPAFKDARTEFYLLASRERKTDDEDVYTRSICKSLVELFSCASVVQPADRHPVDINALAQDLYWVTQEVSQCLNAYHQEAPETRQNPEYAWRAKEHITDRLSLQDKMCLLRLAFEDYAATSKQLTRRNLPSLPLSRQPSISSWFDPKDPNMVSHEITRNGQTYKLKGAPKCGTQHAVWRVEKQESMAFAVEAPNKAQAAKFYKDQHFFDREVAMLKLVHAHASPL
jgi:hypothetical protein